MGLARFGQDYAEELMEVDLNPVFALAEGVLAVDAVIRMNGKTRT